MERSGFPGPSIPVGFAEENIKPLVLYYTKIQPCLSGVTWTLAMKAMLHCLAQRRRKYFIFFYLYNCSVSHRIFKTGKDD